jgi:hypothetical protein
MIATKVTCNLRKLWSEFYFNGKRYDDLLEPNFLLQ